MLTGPTRTSNSPTFQLMIIASLDMRRQWRPRFSSSNCSFSDGYMEMAQQPNESAFKAGCRRAKMRKNLKHSKRATTSKKNHKQEEPQAQTYDTQIHQAHQDAKNENGVGIARERRSGSTQIGLERELNYPV